MKKIFFTLSVILLHLTVATAQTPELWGMTPQGGDYSAGTIFKTALNGSNHSVQNSFFKFDGKKPPYTRLCEASNGKLYGMTKEGGANNLGVLFEYNPITATYTKKIDFDGTTTGSNPRGSLMEASNGKLYGMTQQGGINNQGVLFEYDPATTTFTKKIDFDGTVRGQRPNGSLIEATNGKLYGMTQQGGVNNQGVLFEYNPITATYTKKIDFDGTAKGQRPNGSLIEATNGKFYGMTQQGGVNNQGVLFEYNPITATYTKKIDFDGTAKGSNPLGSLMEASNGKLYGMTYVGGVINRGVLFEYDPATATFIKKLDFGGTVKGNYPQGSLMEASSGKLYGMTYEGGVSNQGVLFEYDPTTTTFTKKIDFDGGVKERSPYGSLMEDSNGKFYGMTQQGGTNNAGVLFEYDPATATFIKKIDFDGVIGGYPQGSLMEASNGKLYGMTSGGGANGIGVLFEYEPTTTTYTKKIDFDGTANGSYPNGSLMEASNGKLYGMTTQGGANAAGVLFEYNPTTSTFTKKIDFDGTVKGRFPYGALMEANNGKLYGMTYSGGANNKGVLFEYDPTTAIFSKKLDFDGTAKGQRPYGSLMEASNGKLYGMTSSGGSYTDGVLFEYDPATATYTKKLDFDGTAKGGYPQGSLTEASNGKLYGMTYSGGANNKGVLFEYDPATATYTKKLDYNSVNGNNPSYGHLIEVNTCYPTVNSFNVTECTTYTVPSGGETYTAVGTYNVMDTIANSCGGDSIMTITVTILSLSGTHNETVCFGGSITVNSTTYDASNLTGTEVFNNIGANSCDSTVTVTLTILPELTGVHNKTVCFGGSITVNNTTYDASNLTGTEVFTNIGANNCDSTVTVTLTILPELTGVHNETVCFGGSTTVNNTTYDASNLTGTEVFNNIGANSCDSTVAVTLTILPELTGVHNETVCSGGSITVNSTVYDASNLTGTEVFNNIGANNCDSTVTVTLTILPELTGVHNVTVCFGGSITVNSTTYDASNLTGTEVFTNIGANNCDSTVAVTLTILPELTGTHNETVCFGGSIMVNNTTYDASNLTGTEVFTNIGANNCDSTVAVTLTILQAIDVSITTTSPTITANQTGATYRWLDCDDNNSVISGETGISFTATANGNYAAEITVGSCIDTSSCTAITGVGINKNTLFNAVNIYPNPNKGLVNINFGTLKNITVKIFNTNGQLVQQQTKINTPTYQFEITGAKGIYFIELTSKKESKRFKVIKD